MQKNTVIVPTYNERDNLPDLVEQILTLPLGIQVVIVDDNSPDGTGELADAMQTRDSRISVIHRPAKLGLGSAYIAGFKHAIAEGSELILTMDADFSHNPRYIPAMVELARHRHLVIGSRYVPGGGVRNWGWRRRFLSRGANLFARTFLGLEASDCTAGFRCYRCEVLGSIDLDGIFSNGYSFLIEMLFKCQRMGYRVGEVAIIFENRTRGKSKISSIEIYKALYTVLRLAFGHRLRYPNSLWALPIEGRLEE